jgi:hypothetical protein
MVYIINLIFKAQINLMQFLEESKVNELFFLLLLILYVLLVLIQSMYIVPWKHLVHLGRFKV